MGDSPNPHHKVPWVAVFLALLALIAFWKISGQMVGQTFGVMNSGTIAVPPSATEPSMPTRGTMVIQGSAELAPSALNADMASGKAGVSSAIAMPTPYYPGYGGTANANDTREFNKMYYNASMMTRDVPKLTRRIETTIRGHGGRVDNESSSEKYGSVSFVVPQDKFDAFRDELESLVDSHYLKVSINSENLLPQKQSIEKQQDYTDMNLDDMAAARKKEIADYNSKKAELQYQIDANDRESAMLAANTSDDQATRANIASRQMQLSTEQSNLKTQLNTLEKSHLATINSIDAQVRYLNGNKDALQQQDQNLMDNVATVQGTVSIQWISVWQIAQLYMPGYTIPGILAFLAILAFMFQRRRESMM